MAKLDTTQWIMIWGMIIVPTVLLIIGGIIKYFWPKKQNGEQIVGKIRSEVIASEINKFLLDGASYRAELLISHLSLSFPKKSVIDQLIKMEKEGTITWDGGPMKPDAKVRLVKYKVKECGQ